MTSESNTNFRKIARDFKGRIELMKKTELQKIESIFLEIYELGLQDYIQKYGPAELPKDVGSEEKA